MAELGGNEVLVRILRDLVSHSSLITLMYQSASAAEHSQEEHAQIVKCAAHRDEERAGAADDGPLQHVEESLAFDRKVPSHDVAMALSPDPNRQAMDLRHDSPLLPRTLVGYGRNPPARAVAGAMRGVAVQFVLNYEESGEQRGC
jgi:hypothetical protein